MHIMRCLNLVIDPCLKNRSLHPNGLTYRKNLTTKIICIKFHEKSVILGFITALVQKLQTKEKQRGHNVPPPPGLFRVNGT